MSKQDWSQILWEAYDQFLLPLGGKKVPTPYRRNEIGSFQKIETQFQGKSSPDILTKTTEELAREKKFNLSQASVEEIREFMRQNKLGIDCSGFSYRMLNYLVQKVKGKNLEAWGFPHIGRTNVVKLTSDELSVPISAFDQAEPGDLIRLNSTGGILHAVIVLSRKGNLITYAHSSSATQPDGVHTGEIIQGQIPADLQYFSFDTTSGDGIRRLKVLA